MSAYTNIEAFLHRAVIFLVDSTLYSAVYPSAITISTIVLTQNLFSWTLVLLPFFGCILIYSMNRLTDKKEDAINQPDRSRFPRRIRITFLTVSLICYVLLEDLVFSKKLPYVCYRPGAGYYCNPVFHFQAEAVFSFKKSVNCHGVRRECPDCACILWRISKNIDSTLRISNNLGKSECNKN